MLNLPIYARAGIYYLHTRLPNGQQFKRSLRTRDKTVAMLSALNYLEAVMDWEELKKRARGFEAVLDSSGSWHFKTEPGNPRDTDELVRFVGSLPLRTKPVQAPAPSVAPEQQENLTGTSIAEVATRYQTRHEKIKSGKTLYEYGNYHTFFTNWVAKRKKVTPYPIRLITNEDIGVYIDDLLAEGKSPQAIQTKYLGALNALFEFAKTIGAFPKEQIIPTRGHKIFNKAKHKPNRKPFSPEDLQSIFAAENLKKARHPEEFWLPLLGLYTGGRISELSQLRTNDFSKIDGIWSVSINEEEDKILKTPASERVIPVHPVLLDLGLIDYLEEVQHFNGRLFPELSPDQFGHYGKQPSRRFGVYLDKLGITDKAKVFHSFRSTANNCLKQAGVPEESRCQFVGHEHDTINSKTYSEPHTIRFLLENVASKLDFPIDFSQLKYTKGKFSPFIAREISKQEKQKNHQAAKTKRTVNSASLSKRS